MATNYTVDPNDERFGQVEADKQQAMDNLDNTYNGMISEADKYYQDQIDASKDWTDKQQQLQQEQTDFTIEKIEQQKDQSAKDYAKEQSGAYVDWRKQSNQYGSEAEKMASAGLANTGYSESSQVSMYNAYQNRVATARESYNQAILNYNNSIKEARLQNNSVLAEIAYQALQQQLELSLQGFQYKNQLLLDQANKKVELENTYWNRYQDVLNQINTENALAEEVRQFDQNYELNMQQLELQKKELDESIRQFEQNYELKVKEYNEGIRQFNEEIARLKAKDKQEYELEIKNLELKKKQLEQDQKQFEAQQKLEREKLAETKRQFNAELAYQKSKTSGSSGGGSKITKSPSSGAKTGVNSIQADVETKKAVLTQTKANSSGLGIGPISDSYAQSLVKAGKVYVTAENKKLVYKWKAPWNASNYKNKTALKWSSFL